MFVHIPYSHCYQELCIDDPILKMLFVLAEKQLLLNNTQYIFSFKIHNLTVVCLRNSSMRSVEQVTEKIMATSD